MKKTISYLLLISSLITLAQQTPRSPYTAWTTIYEEGVEPFSKRVQFCYSLTTCTSNGIVGYAFYKIKNEYSRDKAYIAFDFDYRNCDNEVKTEHINVSLKEEGEQKNIGMHFFGKQIEKMPYNIAFKDYGIKSVQSNSNSSSGLSFPGENKEAEALIKKGDEALANNFFKVAIAYYNQAKEKGGFVVIKIQDARQKEIDYKKEQEERAEQEYQRKQEEITTLQKNRRVYEIQRQQTANNYAEQIAQTQALIDKSNKDTQQLTDAVTNGIQTLGKIWLDAQERKQEKERKAEERRALRELEARRDREIQAKEEEERQNAEIERQEQARQLAIRQEHHREYEEKLKQEKIQNILLNADNLYDNKNYEQAFNYYQEAANLENSYAQYSVGYMYNFAEGTSLDIDKAIYFYEKAANNNEVDAQRFLGEIFEAQINDSLAYENRAANVVKTIKWYSKAAQADNVEAIKRIVSVYQNNDYDQDLEQQIQFCESYLRMIQTKPDDLELAVNKTDALLQLTKIYLGENNFKNIEKGRIYLEQLAVINSYYSYCLGKLYFCETIFKYNGIEGLKWIEKGLENEYLRTETYFYLGKLYQTGDTEIPKDNAKADDYLKKTLNSLISENNKLDNHDKYNIAKMYQNGLGTNKNYKEAIVWYKKASSYTMEFNSSDNIAALYEQGGFGIEKNTFEAEKWYKKAFDDLVATQQMIVIDTTAMELAIEIYQSDKLFNIYNSLNSNKKSEERMLYNLGNVINEMSFLEKNFRLNAFHFNSIGFRLENGCGTKLDNEAALKNYLQAYEIGINYSIVNIIRIYFKQQNTEKIEAWNTILLNKLSQHHNFSYFQIKELKTLFELGKNGINKSSEKANFCNIQCKILEENK
jgi:TPR repeat protein